MDEIFPEITGELRIHIHARLLDLDSARRSDLQSGRRPRPKPSERLELVYNVFAGELLRAGWQLTEASLADISTWVIDWAWKHKWLSTMRPMPGWPGFFYVGDPPERWRRQDGGFEPLSDADLRASVRKLLEGRVAHWRVEMLAPTIPKPAAPKVAPEKAAGWQGRKELVDRALSKCVDKKDLADRLGVSTSSIYRWVKNPNLVASKKRLAIPERLPRIAAGKPAK